MQLLLTSISQLEYLLIYGDFTEDQHDQLRDAKNILVHLANEMEVQGEWK